MTETTLLERTAPSPPRDRNISGQNTPGDVLNVAAGEPLLGNAVITLAGLTKTYTMGEVKVQALENFSTTIRQGDYVAIIGPSGSGKSTLMNLIGLLHADSRRLRTGRPRSIPAEPQRARPGAQSGDRLCFSAV
jgi:ATPase subunit of ABC transporter with duplicated ATPase domains